MFTQLKPQSTPYTSAIKHIAKPTKSAIANTYARYLAKLTTLLVFVIGLSACSVQQVAFFDEGSLQMAQGSSIRVDMFFARLSRRADDQRSYADSEDEYLEIAVQLNALLVRNQNRQFNELSVKQIKLLIELWESEEKSHKRRNTIPTPLLKIHRKQFQTAFASIMRAEQYKVNPLHDIGTF